MLIDLLSVLEYSKPDDSGTILLMCQIKVLLTLGRVSLQLFAVKERDFITLKIHTHRTHF